jgi:hypothetical protein
VVEIHRDEPDEHIAADLEELLAEDDRVNEQGVRVQVRNGVVMVRGTVATRNRRDAILALLGEQLPDTPVELDVAVLAEELHPPSGEECVS